MNVPLVYLESSGLYSGVSEYVVLLSSKLFLLLAGMGPSVLEMVPWLVVIIRTVLMSDVEFLPR